MLYTIKNVTSSVLELEDVNNVRYAIAAGQKSLIDIATATANSLSAKLGAANVVAVSGNGSNLAIETGGNLTALVAAVTATLKVAQAGSTGSDSSTNKPALPNIGANFPASGPYSSYYLSTILAANPARLNVDIENLSGAQAAVMRDDGTAASGAAPTNASVFSLAGGTGVGAQGGAWSSQTFRGRLSIFSAITSVITFTGALVAAVSGTLSVAWTGVTGSFYVTFSDGSIRKSNFTNGSTTVTWTGAVTATATANAATAQITVMED